MGRAAFKGKAILFVMNVIQGALHDLVVKK